MCDDDELEPRVPYNSGSSSPASVSASWLRRLDTDELVTGNGHSDTVTQVAQCLHNVAQCLRRVSPATRNTEVATTPASPASGRPRHELAANRGQHTPKAALPASASRRSWRGGISAPAAPRMVKKSLVPTLSTRQQLYRELAPSGRGSRSTTRKSASAPSRIQPVPQKALLPKPQDRVPPARGNLQHAASGRGSPRTTRKSTPSRIQLVPQNASLPPPDDLSVTGDLEYLRNRLGLVCPTEEVLGVSSSLEARYFFSSLSVSRLVAAPMKMASKLLSGKLERSTQNSVKCQLTSPRHRVSRVEVAGICTNRVEKAT